MCMCLPSVCLPLFSSSVPKGVWFNSHTKSWTCTTAGPKRQLLVFSSNRFGFAEARRMAISARLASLKLEGLPVPNCPLLYEPPGGMGGPGIPGGLPGDGGQSQGGPGIGGIPGDGWGGYSPHEGEDGYAGVLGGVGGPRRRRRQRDGGPQLVHCRQRRAAEGDDSGSDPWDMFRSGLPFVAEAVSSCGCSSLSCAFVWCCLALLPKWHFFCSVWFFVCFVICLFSVCLVVSSAGLLFLCACVQNQGPQSLVLSLHVAGLHCCICLCVAFLWCRMLPPMQQLQDQVTVFLRGVCALLSAGCLKLVR